MDTQSPGLFVSVVLLLFSVNTAWGQQQYFRIRPKDVKVHEGSEALLECEVTNLAGAVQWTKDGFALGFKSVIPGFPRYSVVGDAASGVFHLRIVNASLDDDAEYQCQVGPARLHTAIRANARLSVISPPSSIKIVDHAPNSKIEIREHEQFTLECQVKNAKPAAKIVWYRGNVELKLDKRSDKTTTVETPGDSRAKRYDVSSRIQLQPTAEDDYADYTCEARHEALPPDMPLRVTVQLSVLYPPGVPYIDGYTEGEVIRRGQTVELVCRSRGGNPPAQLIWYKNGEQIRMAYRTAGRLSENIYSFTADTSDNKAKYKCEASNIMSTEPLKAETQLTVLFAPSQVTISGPTEARVGDIVNLTCTTAPSNPPAEIKWMVAGRHIRNASSTTKQSAEGGAITTSNISVLVTPNKRSLVVICHGLNLQLTENVVSTHTINVLYPPSQPIITGFEEGVSIASGTVQKLMCISSGGNPLATITWYKNDKKINSVTKVNDRSVSSEVTILTNVTDNEARYKCEASNSATEIPLFETVTLSVLFPPDHVVIRKEPVKLVPGIKATLTCDSSSSNPEARLSWWRAGIAVPGIANMTRPGLHGGKVSSITLTLDITPDLNGIVYTCQATNEALQRSVHDAITLDVLYKPIFDEIPEEPEIGTEGQAVTLSLPARGNPNGIAYTWSKDGKPIVKGKNIRLISDGPNLNITNLQKDDGGIYTLEAVNSEGSTTANISLTVQYSAVVKEVPESVMVAPGETAHLYCVVDGNPLKESHITWKHKKFTKADMERTEISFRNGTSYIDILSPSREDNGPFKCIANNGIGTKSSKEVFLIVKYKPEIDKSPSISKAASNNGETGRLTCRASGAPTIHFTWSREGSTLPVNKTAKYYIEVKQIDFITYESTLFVTSVKSSDYGAYECVARNELGIAKTTIRLDVTSPPDPPSALTVLNVTHDSVTVSWISGFSGGMPQSYRLRYRPTAGVGDGYQYVDVTQLNVTSFTITGLAVATDYTISIMAFNKLGSSKYLPDLLRAKTSSRPDHSPSLIPEEILAEKGDVPRLVIIGVSITGALLVLLNIGLVFGFIYRKKNKRKREAASEQSSSKSATIEMYAPSSYNETVTGETLSSVSEKSESYSNGDSNPDCLDDGTKVAAASTYLIDQVDYPYQYPAYEMQHQPKPLHEEVPEPMINRSIYNHAGEGAKIHYSTLPPPHMSDGPYYNISPDARYIPYPPQVDFGPPIPNTGSLRRPQHRATVVPPDVTVSHNPPLVQNGPPAPLLSTFNPGLSYPPAMETEGHLV